MKTFIFFILLFRQLIFLFLCVEGWDHHHLGYLGNMRSIPFSFHVIGRVPCVTVHQKALLIYLKIPTQSWTCLLPVQCCLLKCCFIMPLKKALWFLTQPIFHFQICPKNGSVSFHKISTPAKFSLAFTLERILCLQIWELKKENQVCCFRSLNVLVLPFKNKCIVVVSLQNY